MANPKPSPGVIHLPCRKCGGKREHFGSGVCWDCMGPAERERLAHEPERPTKRGHDGRLVPVPTLGGDV